MSNRIDLKEIWPIIDEVISTGGEFRLTPYGISMLPLLEPGKCEVTLVSPGEIKKGDIVLFVRQSGQFVLHRVVAVKKDYYNMCGDNEVVIEKRVYKDRIRAVVKDIYIGEERLNTESDEYKSYLKSIRRKISRHKIPVFLSKVKRRLFKKKST